MARIDIKNGESFELKNPNVDLKEVERVANEAKQTILRVASPFFNSIKFFNKTKSCSMHLSFSEGQVVVMVENPADEALDEAGDIPKVEKV